MFKACLTLMLGFLMVILSTENTLAQHISLNGSFEVQAANDLSWSADGQLLSIATAKGLVIYNTYTGETTVYLADQPILSVSFHPTELQIAYVVQLETFGLLDLTTGEIASIDVRGAYRVAFSPDGSLLATGTAENEIRLWKIHEKRFEAMAILPSDEDTSVIGLIFTPNGETLISLHSGFYPAEVWPIPVDVSPVETLRPIETPIFEIPAISIAIDPQGNLAFGMYQWRDQAPNIQLFQREIDQQSTASVWTQSTEISFESKEIEYTSAITFNADGSLIASGGSDGSVRIWETMTGTVSHELTPHEDWISDITFNPNGIILAVASRDGLIRLWSLE